ncbi:MAG: 30S ribosome-binding factor RbfA [Malacoplasma sp.]
MNKSWKIRKERYESYIKDIVSKAILLEVYDDYIKMATILDVELTNDFSLAKIYVSTINKSDLDFVIQKINTAKSFFKKLLANELELKKVPNIIFLKDVSSEKFEEVENILKEINKDYGKE